MQIDIALFFYEACSAFATQIDQVSGYNNFLLEEHPIYFRYY